MMKPLFPLIISLLTFGGGLYAQNFQLNKSGYFQDKGVDVMAFDDIYPEGHQGGVSLIMHGHRIATNGDIRLEETPGQWQPVPKQRERIADPQTGTIKTYLSYPDSSRHMTGFNPMIYPDLHFNYEVITKAEGNAIRVTVNLDRPIPSEYIGKVGFNLELFPGILFGKPWLMDQQGGIFPRQANGPTLESRSNATRSWDYIHSDKSIDKQANKDILGRQGDYNPIVADDIVSAPYSTGHTFTVCPDDPLLRFTVHSEGSELKLYDGRMNHNNGWFVLRAESHKRGYQLVNYSQRRSGLDLSTCCSNIASGLSSQPT